MHQFLGFTFDSESGDLRANGRSVSIEGQPGRVLATLLINPGRTVTRAELISVIWGQETHVNFDDNLNYCIRHLRRALNDDARAPKFIETLPKRGYRFIAPVTVGVPTAPRRPWLAAFAAAAALLILIAERTPNNHHELLTAALRHLHALVF
jgi:DNA-binding winged helix-turn-helix (wHTH) protein